MGEGEFKANVMVSAVKGALAEQGEAARDEMGLTTLGGRYQVRWDDSGGATMLGQLPFFAEFLEVTGVFERWERKCPMAYTSPNAPETKDVLGTWLLSILDGQSRYAHITGLRGDGVAPGILGMNKIVSDESPRRGLAHLAPTLERCPETQRPAREAQLAKTANWMDQALMESVCEVLETDWILDTDATIKLLYGHQDGAEVSYNPIKPGRPSHVIHTYGIANVRLVLDAEVQHGKAHAAGHSLPRLILLLKSLPAEQRPRLVRGDIAFGIDPVMGELEQMAQAYLFKLKQTTGAKRLIERLWRQNDWQDVGEGYHAVETRLRLSGWEQDRRVVVIRRAVRQTLAVEKKASKTKGQQTLEFASVERGKLWEYAVLVTNSAYDLSAIGQLYRDRADCDKPIGRRTQQRGGPERSEGCSEAVQNGFDELKNQWDWGGYTTRDLERCNLSAHAVALIYNWWSWYVRLAHPKTRREAITSRPLLLSGVARQTSHAGQQRLLVTLVHACSNQIKSMIANVRKGLDTILATAPQLPKLDRWHALVRYIISQMITVSHESPLPYPPNLPPAVPLPTG